MLEKRIQQFTDQTEHQGDRVKTRKQSLEDNLLNQHKADATISELQHKEKLRLWKEGLEQKIQVIIEQNEQQKEKFKTWQPGLEETLELKTQEIIDQNKRQIDENVLARKDARTKDNSSQIRLSSREKIMWIGRKAWRRIFLNYSKYNR